MSTSTFFFLAVRAAHVLLAAAWLGTVAFTSLFLAPALEDVGPAGASVMSALGRRGIHAAIASLGGITVLTGIWLYWRFTGGFEPATSATIAARVFGAGGAAGILALIVGGAVVGRCAKKLTDLGERLPGASDAAQQAALMTEIAALRRRLSTSGKVVLVFQVIALLCMAIGHYV